MAKRRNVRFQSGMTTALLQLEVPIGRYVTAGAVTNVTYVFDGGGARVAVDSRDAPALLAKTRQMGCCGSPPATVRLFRKIEEERR